MPGRLGACHSRPAERANNELWLVPLHLQVVPGRKHDEDSVAAY